MARGNFPEHQAELKGLLVEVDAVLAELAGHREVAAVLLGAGGGFKADVSKLRALAR